MSTATAPRIGSLCSGYGGLDMAVQDVLGGELVFVADPDPGAAKILAHHHPDVPNLGDITATDWEEVLAHGLAVEVLTAGFPCQDVSVAGRRAGMRKGNRSGLWLHVLRAIRVLRPRLVVIENVPGLRTEAADSDLEPCPWCMGDTERQRPVRALAGVLAGLADAGFDAEWVSVPASDVGAPHRRERVFLIAWLANTQGPRLEAWRQGRLEGDAAAPDPDRVGGHRAATQPWADRREKPAGNSASHAQGVGYGYPRSSCDGGMATAPVAGTPSRVAAVADADGSGSIAQPHGEPQRPETDYVHDGLDAPGRVLGWGPYGGAITRWEHATGRRGPVPTEPGKNDQPRLSPVFVEWMQGLPAGHVTDPAIGLTRTQQLHALGNGVVWQQGAYALRILLGRAFGLAA